MKMKTIHVAIEGISPVTFRRFSAAVAAVVKDFVRK